MKKYERPVVILNSDLAEGVYTASGDTCYSITANIHQTPQEGRGDYRIQLNAAHGATDGHHSGVQTLTISFNLPVEYSSSNGTLIAGSGTSVLQIQFGYHSNGSDSIGLGELVVKADPGLAIMDCSLDCNRSCGLH